MGPSASTSTMKYDVRLGRQWYPQRPRIRPESIRVAPSPPRSSPLADPEPAMPARDVALLAALIARLVARELAPLLPARATVDPADVSPRRGTVGKP